MTSMISPRGQRFTPRMSLSTRSAAIPVPPAATWNGGVDDRPVQIRTHVVIGSRPVGQERGFVEARQKKQGYREALGQLALGGVLGLTAIIGMLSVDSTGADELVTPAEAHLATMDVK